MIKLHKRKYIEFRCDACGWYAEQTEGIGRPLRLLRKHGITCPRCLKKEEYKEEKKTKK